MPVKAITRGKASVATQAHVVVSKFDHHLPLYRQAEIMAAQGIDIDCSTLAGWAEQAARLLDPLVTRIGEEGLTASKLHTDDTPVPMLVSGKGKTAQARLWVYAAHERASSAISPAMICISSPLIAVVFIRRRNSKILSACCKLVKEVACGAQLRRNIFEQHQTSPTPLTTDLLQRVAELYRIEEEVRRQPPDIRRQHRQDYSKAQVEALRRLSPKSAMAKALLYGRKRWAALTLFLDEGMAEMDNKLAERAMRPVAVGRKNWLFAGSKAGGERAAAMYSVIETCKLNGVEPQAYIANVIEKMLETSPSPVGTK